MKKSGSSSADNKSSAGVSSSRITAGKALGLYIWYGGILLCIFHIAMFFLAQMSRQVSDFWVRWWTADRFNYYNG